MKLTVAPPGSRPVDPKALETVKALPLTIKHHVTFEAHEDAEKILRELRIAATSIGRRLYVKKVGDVTSLTLHLSRDVDPADVKSNAT